MESQECLPSNAGSIFDVLSFVKNHVLPLDALKVLLILSDLESPVSIATNYEATNTHQLITGYKDMERSVLVIADLLFTPELPERGSILDVTPVRQSLQGRHEPTDLLLPIMECRCRCNDKERAPDIMGLSKVSQQRY